MSSQEKEYDVVVVGAGNAALCAALAASDGGASVLILEKAPEYLRGGNSFFSGGLFRFAYDNSEDISSLVPDVTPEEFTGIDVGSYPQNLFYDDLLRVTEGMANSELAQVLVAQSYPTMKWLQEQGVRWILAYGRQAFRHEGKLRFWGGLILEAVGAGKGLVDQEFDIARLKGIDIRYSTKATKLFLNATGEISKIQVKGPEGFSYLHPKAVILASGGFEANAEMRTRYLGPGWEMAKVRGTEFNTGDSIRMALDIGAQSFGHWSGCHSVAWDLNAPPTGDRAIADLFQKHSYPFGLIVNVEGNRFVDEGADLRNFTYAKYGKEILNQPQRVAFQIFDQKTKHLLRDEYFISQASVVESNDISELASGLGIDPDSLESTISEFNSSVQDGDYNPTKLDGKSTKGITPPKSNWALEIDNPPYMGYAVTCGITFTFGGLKINSRAQVLDTENQVIPGLFAAGELTGGIFYNNYPGGAGLMAGSVYGKIAGDEAASHSR